MYHWLRDEGMHDYSFYSAILGLSSKWRILNVTVDERSGDIELHIRSRKGSKFSCPSCGALRLPSGVNKARWLHENHLNIRFYISALIPVITCEQCGELKAEVPWTQAGSICEEQEPADSAKLCGSPGNPRLCPEPKRRACYARPTAQRTPLPPPGA